MYFSHLGVFLISIKPLTTENNENETTPKICQITVLVNEVIAKNAFLAQAKVKGREKGKGTCTYGGKWSWFTHKQCHRSDFLGVN